MDNGRLAASIDRRITAVAAPLIEAAITSLKAGILSSLGAVTPGAVTPAPDRLDGPRRFAAATEGLCGVATNDELGSAAHCTQPQRCRGYCSSHYQQARKYAWPMPCPEDFEAPPPRPRGRPKKGIRSRTPVQQLPRRKSSKRRSKKQ